MRTIQRIVYFGAEIWCVGLATTAACLGGSHRRGGVRNVLFSIAGALVVGGLANLALKLRPILLRGWATLETAEEEFVIDEQERLVIEEE